MCCVQPLSLATPPPPTHTLWCAAVKTLKAPRFDLVKLMELHEGNDSTESKEVKNADVLVESLEGAGGRL